MATFFHVTSTARGPYPFVGLVSTWETFFCPCFSIWILACDPCFVIATLAACLCSLTVILILACGPCFVIATLAACLCSSTVILTAIPSAWGQAFCD
jgi:hypothetical protein